MAHHPIDLSPVSPLGGRRVSSACLLFLGFRFLSFLSAALDVHFNPILPAKEMLSRRKRSPVMKARPFVGLLYSLSKAASWLLFKITQHLKMSQPTVVGL